MYKAKVTSKGQVTVPKELREKMGLKQGDYLCIKETKEGYIIKKKIEEDTFSKYVGFLNDPKSSDKIIEELRGE